MILVSVIIKALNEEHHIAAAIESALKAVEGIHAEVIIADSASTDRTVEVSSRYPVKIVQLARPDERGCGVGPQLGYQHSSGSYICLMDGDMVLDAGFIKRGLDFLSRNPSVAGVGGVIVEKNVTNLEFRRRVKRKSSDQSAGSVGRLNGGGLYRGSAINAVGYFSDRNLHGCEEFELATRLRAAGWGLHRLDCPFVYHYGHTEGAYRLLWRRLQTRYLCGSGEALRAALGRPQFWLVINELRELRLWLAVYIWWSAILASIWLTPAALAPPAVTLALMVFPVAVMALKYQSLKLGAYSVFAWNVHALGAALGLFRPRVDPASRIESHVIENQSSGFPLSDHVSPNADAQSRGEIE